MRTCIARFIAARASSRKECVITRGSGGQIEIVIKRYYKEVRTIFAKRAIRSIFLFPSTFFQLLRISFAPRAHISNRMTTVWRQFHFSLAFPMFGQRVFLHAHIFQLIIVIIMA